MTACPNRRLVVCIALAAIALTSQAGLAQEPPRVQQPLTVELASGRRFTGVVDTRSSDERLVLRFTRGGATLRRSIEWDRVVSASVAGQSIEAGKVKEAALAMRSEGSGIRVQGSERTSEVRVQRSEVRGQESPTLPTSDLRPPTSDPRSPTPDPENPRVTSVSFDARIANWDADVETDGILVDLFPLGEDGSLVPAAGTVEVELFAPQKRDFNQAPLSGGDTLERVSRWAQVVGPEDFTTRGARLKLPFAAVHPEFDLDWIGMGLAHVRLVVPGDGVFEDSIDGLRIRPYAPLRDRLEMNTGRRFVPTETVGRGRVLNAVRSP